MREDNESTNDDKQQKKTLTIIYLLQYYFILLTNIDRIDQPSPRRKRVKVRLKVHQCKAGRNGDEESRRRSRLFSVIYFLKQVSFVFRSKHVEHLERTVRGS